MTRQADVQKSMNEIAGGNQVEKASEVRTYDREAVQTRMAQLRAEVAQKKAAEANRLEALQAVEVDPADVAVIAAELHLSEEDALYKLREKKGDVVALLREAVNLPKVKA